MLTIDETNSIKRNLTQISLEASVLSNMVSSIKNIFPDLMETLRSSFSKTENLPEIKIKLTSEQKFLIKELVAYKYIDIAELSTQVPEGFNGGYLDYIMILKDIVDRISDVNARLLQPYSVYLSSFLTNKEAKFNTVDQTRLYDKFKNIREEDIKNLGNFFNDSSNKSVTKIGQVVKRNSSFPGIYSEVGNLAKKIDSINFKLINDNVKKCLSMLDIIIERISKNEIEHVSPEVTQNLAYGAYEVASEIEFFAVVYYKVLALVSSVDATTVKINNYIRNIH